MSRRKRHTQTFVLSLAALALAGLAVLRLRRPEVVPVRPPMLEPVPGSIQPPAPRPRPAAMRIALAASFAVLFFAGAAFTAGAGDQVALLIEDTGVAEQVQPAPADATLAEPAAAPEPEAAPEATPTPAPAPVAPAPAVEPAPAAEPIPAAEPAETAPVESAPVESAPVEAPQVAPTEYRPAPAPAAAPAAAPTPAKPAPAATKPRTRATATSAPRNRKWVTVRAQLPPARPAEVERSTDSHSEPTIWLNRSLPDPTPPSARLTREFARSLGRAARTQGADWASVLGVLRAQGNRGSAPASPAELRRLAGRVRGDAWRGALALTGRTSFADRAAALADYHRAVGLESLVTGLAASKERLVKRVLADRRVTLYAGGRADLAAGRVDVRIVALLSYLAERHGSVTVSSLFSGHRKYARPGVVSAHVYGQAVDIASVGGSSIAGHQQPGGITESAVRSILLLPAELQPQQVISLLGLGGPSFPLADHGDHIHVGY